MSPPGEEQPARRRAIVSSCPPARQVQSRPFFENSMLAAIAKDRCAGHKGGGTKLSFGVLWMLLRSARKLINASGTIKSMDVVVPVKRGNIELPVRLRTVAKPEEDVAVLLAHLRLRLPSRSKTVQNVVEKNR